MTNNNDNDNKDDGGGTIISNSNTHTNSNTNQINSSLIKIIASNSSSPVPMMKSTSMTSITSTTTTSSLINSGLTSSQFISNAESEIYTKRESNDINNANQIKYDESFSITSEINKATEYNKSPKSSIRSNSTHSLNEYYSSSPIPTPKPRSITKSNTIPLPTFNFTTKINSNNNVADHIEEYINDFSFMYSEEELNAYKNVTNFICKIAQLILRSRVGLSYNHNYNSSLNKKYQDRDMSNDITSGRANNSLNQLNNSMGNLSIKASYASSLSSNESQPQSIPYSLNSSYNSSYENSYPSNPNGVLNSINSNTRNNDIQIPTPSIDNIKQLHGLLIDRLPFWRNRIPINIDIFATGNSNNSHNKVGNENFRRRKSNDFSNGNDMERDRDGSFYDRPSTSTRIRSSSISNIYSISNSNSSISSSTKFNNKRLLERWVVSYEPNNDSDTMNKGRNSKVDTTDFILLVQSLYSYIRLMPLHSLLSDNSIQKSDLQYCISTADGFLLLPLLEQNNDVDFCDIGSSGFDLSAKLKVYKFTKASNNLGNLHISVVYDGNIINNKNTSAHPSNISHSLSKSIASNSSSLNFNDSKLKNSSNRINNPQNNDKNLTIILPSKENIVDNKKSSGDSSSSIIKTSDEKTNDKKESNVSNDDETPSSPNRRKSCPTIGSPFPSPKTHTKVLSLTQAKYAYQPQSSSLSSSSNLLHKLMDKQRLEKYSSSVHSLSDNNSLSSQSNLLLSGFNYKKSGTNDHNTNKINFLTPINISNSMPPLDKNNNTKVLNNNNQSLSVHKNNNYQSNSMELFGSLVGSYEESILSGRMSTLPSKPIKFISEIGVIGFGKCHPRLKCPPHINITFPVYFYEIPDQNDFFTTPYVGTVDIEQYLQKQNLLKQQKQQQQQQEQEQQQLHQEPEKHILLKNESEEKSGNNSTDNNSLLTPTNDKIVTDSKTTADGSTIPSVILLNDQPMLPRASSSSSLNGLNSKFPGYRIPFKGQIQIIIKNPSKTAVKVFLIPYDFRDMPPNTKTFIRQKSYLKNIKNGNSHDQKYSLRYAIHLQFISPSKKRLYLYKTLRVVFAHKAPEKDEKLCTISDGPVDPKYIPIVDNNINNYSQNTNDLNNDKLFGTELNIKPDGRNLSVKEDNGFFSSSYSSRRRSSFGSNMMMLAEMGVNLGDYSVSPVKPIIHQHHRSLSNGSNNGLLNDSSLLGSSSIQSSTRITKPLFFGKGNMTNQLQLQNSDINQFFHGHTKPTSKVVPEHEPIKKISSHYPSFQSPSPSQSHYSLQSQLHSYHYLSDETMDKMAAKLPPRGDKIKESKTYGLINSNYSSGGLTKSVVDDTSEQNKYYPKTSKHTSGISNITHKHSLRNLTSSSLESKTQEEESTTLSSTTNNFKVFNYIN